MKLFGLAVLYSILQFPFVPNADVTYGSLCSPQDEDFVEYRYPEKIAWCVRNVTVNRKSKIYDQYGVPNHCRQQYTIDHYLPLSMGGSNHIENLWPEHKAIKGLRQNLEVETYERLKKAEITQSEAFEIITQAKLHPPIDQLPPGPEGDDCYPK